MPDFRDDVYRRQFHLREPRDFESLQSAEGEDSDRARAELTARRVGRRLVYVPARGWMVCDDASGLWREDPGALAVRELVYWSTGAESEPAVRRVESLLRGVCRVDAGDFVEHPDVLHVAGGQVLVLTTGQVRPCEPEDFCQWSTGVVWNPSAVYKPWNDFLRWVLPDDDVRNWAQRWFGYCLAPRVAEEKVLLLHGPGGDGKSTLMEAIAGVMGRYAQEGVDPALVLRRGRVDHPTEVASLAGKRLAWINELADDAALDEAKLKRLVSTGAVRARFIARDYVELPITWKFVLTTNTPPRVLGQTPGTWRRLRPLQLRSLRELRETGQLLLEEGSDETDLKALLAGADARAAILRWCVDGYRLWRDRPLDTDVPHALRLEAEAYQTEEDRVAPWAENYLAFDDAAGTLTVAELSRLVEQHRAQGVDVRSVRQWLQVRGVEHARHADGSRTGGAGWRGVRTRVSTTY